MKARNTLGRYLLRGFQRFKSKNKLARKKRRRSAPILRLSRMQASENTPSQASFPSQISPASLGTPEPIPVIEVEVEKLETPPPQKQLGVEEVQIHPIQVQKNSLETLSYRGASLSTQDLLKPSDRLRQSIEAFLSDQRSVHTRRAYQKDLKRLVQFLHGRNLRVGLENLNRSVLISYKESLLADGLEHTTIDRHLASLRSFFNWLVDDGILEKSPAEGVRFLNPKKVSRTLGFSDEEVVRVLAQPDLHTRSGALHYAILMVLFYCGLRRSELCELKTSNLGLERKQRVLRLRGKGNVERVIVMILPVWSAIQYYFYIAKRDFSASDYLFSPLKNNRTGILNKPLDTSTIFYVVTKYARKAGIANRVSPHSCRATAISNARDHHVPDRAIQEFAGWSSTDMITRYDKRKSSIENSAAHSISYGAEERAVPFDINEND